jgi:very-short-patch-repair endonuclease
MWKHLSNKQMCGYKFRRQHGFDQYVVDFYCPEPKLAIEIDGESHFQPGAKEYDHEREEYIKAFGVKLLRFQNTDVYQNLRGVLGEIYKEVSAIGG